MAVVSETHSSISKNEIDTKDNYLKNKCSFIWVVFHGVSSVPHTFDLIDN